MRLERLARVISAYETMVIPGLLQTEAYARALYEARVPAYTEQEIVRHVEARMERGAVLMRKTPPRVGYVIEESILERPLGGEAVLKEQLRHLLECMRTMNHLTLQVMPTRRHTHAGLNGPMKLMAIEEGRHLVYQEGQGGATLISKSERVSDLFDSWTTPPPPSTADHSPGAPHTGNHRDRSFSTRRSSPRAPRTWSSSWMSRFSASPGSGANG